MALQTLSPPDERLLVRGVGVCPVPDDVSQNASYTFGYTGSQITSIVKTLDSTIFTRTLTYSGSTLTAISAWVRT